MKNWIEGLADNENFRLPNAQIVDLDTLDQLLSSRYNLFITPEIKLQIPSLLDDEQRLWQSRIDKIVLNCACREATIGTAFMLLIFTFFYFSTSLHSYSTSEKFLLGLFFAVLGAGIGKFLGHIYLRHKLKIILDELRVDLVNRIEIKQSMP